MQQLTLLLCAAGLFLCPSAAASGRPRSKKGSGGNPRQNTIPSCALYDPITGQVEKYSDCNNPTDLCGVDPSTGEAVGCVLASDCPASVPDHLVTCDGSSTYCCCQDKHPADLICNHLRNDKDDTVWTQACGLPELSRGPAPHVCQQSWTTTTTPIPTEWCIKLTSFDKASRTAKGCSDPGKLCGIDTITGLPSGCVPESECPPGVSGYPVECDGSSSYCCCKDDPRGNIRCNDNTHLFADSVWIQACSLPRLKDTDACQVSWTYPPPPPRMPQKCLDYCRKKAPPVPQGTFKARCGDKEPTAICPSPCPRGCDDYCTDGENMDCPNLAAPVPTEEPDTSTAPQISAEPKDEGLGAGEIVGIVIAVLIALLIIGVVAYYFWANAKRNPARGPVRLSLAADLQPVNVGNPPEVTPQQYQAAAQSQYPGAQQGFTQSAQFAPQQGTQNYPQGPSSMPNMRYQ